MIRHVLNKLGFVRSALAVGVGIPFLVASAYAQTPAGPVTNAAPVDAAANTNPGAGNEATTERVIVTGSYIPTAETESALPVTVYTAEVLQKAGANTPVEGLRQLPSFVGNAVTENDSNAGNGQATINLRAIGSQNTLVLINGRRAFLGRGANGVGADINAIPISATTRTEVLKDGASAIYGSDAVAGVVNFILLDGPGEAPYEGAEVFALYGNTTESDAHVRQTYIRGGVKTDKVSVAASAEYYSRANLFSRDRAQLAGTGNLSNSEGGLGRGGLNGNSPTYAGRVRINNGPGQTALQLVLIDPTNNAPTSNVLENGMPDPAGYRFFEVTTPAGTDPSRFNFRAFTPAIPAVEKALTYVTGRYKIFGDGLQIYGDMMYAKTKQDNGLAAAPFALAGAVGRASPFNPFGTRLTQVRYRLVNDLGNRRSFYDSDYFRYVAGLNGDFNLKDNNFISHFGYDTGIVYEQYYNLRTDSGDAQLTPLTDEITAGNFNPFIGQFAPVAGVAPTYDAAGNPTGTAPYDNAAAAARASYIGHSLFYEHDWLVDAKINGHLFPGLWNGGIDMAIGYEHRETREHQIPDPVQANGDQLGFNAAPNTKYKQEVDSYFGEITVPIVTSTMNVPFVRSFEVSAAYRYEEFTDFDSFHQNPLTDEISFDNGGTPRVSIRYQPFADLTLRGNWNESFRSPTPSALFDPGSQNFPVLFDPLRATTLQPPSGVEQIGNIALQPEQTDAWSGGLVYTPKWLSGFTITADFYQLYTSNVILTSPDFAQIMLTSNGVSAINNGGVPTVFVAPDNAVPGGGFIGVLRDAAGNVDSIFGAQTNNASKRLVEGVDITAVYEIPTQNFGTFTLSGAWNHFFIWKAGGVNFLGNYNNGTAPLAPGGVPFNKGFLRGEWQWKGFDFVATGNYIGDYEDDPAFILGNTVIGGGLLNPSFALHHRVSSYETLDMQLSYEFKKPEMQAAAADYSKDAKDAKSMTSVAGADNSSIWQRMLWNTKVTVGVNNAFDRYPPTVLGAFNDNYDTSLYSIRNRYWYVSLSKKF